MNAAYRWERWPGAEALVEHHLNAFLLVYEPARTLADEMEHVTSTRMLDWIDHLVVDGDEALESTIRATGFVPDVVEAPHGMTVFSHPGAQLPRLAVRRTGDETPRTSTVAIKADAIDDVLMVRGMHVPVAGSLCSPYRVATLGPAGERVLQVVERRGYRGLLPQEMPAGYAERYFAARSRWATRPRRTDDEADGMAETLALAQRLVAEMGRDTAAWIVFEVERDYWQRRNWAGQVQKARQDRLGLGWANHDHHTFRSSRTTFTALIATLETLGFVCRERFYAGHEAGWGAQVLEQPACGLVVFADVDLFPHETDLDFAHTGLADHPQLGTVGLWCALHGESLLGAGMHHLEGQFEFGRLRDDLAAMGVDMMQPFSDAPHLRQAFTKGERWPISPGRLERLRSAGRITEEQYAKFQANGAIGSHLENLQRREGYKGFNQQNVSAIIKATDPRS